MKRFISMMLISTMLLLMIVPMQGAVAVSYGVIHGGGLRLREAPNFNAVTINVYPNGSTVELLSGKVNGWYNVRTSDGHVGYMHGDYIHERAGAIPDTGTVSYIISSNGYGVRMRTGPSTTYPVITKYPVGTPVTILETGSSWAKINVGGRIGYMMTEFLSTTGTGSGTGTTVIGTAKVTSTNGYGVRLRTGPSTNNSIIGVYPVGTTASVLKQENGWSNIIIGSRVGWMMNEFLIQSYTNQVTRVGINNVCPSVGQKLSAVNMVPSNATVTYEWLVGGTVRGTESTYVVGSTDVGKTIQLRITGTGNYSGNAISGATAAVVSFTPIVGVTLSETNPYVGQTLAVQVAPKDAQVNYSWKVNGYEKSTAATYVVEAKDVGYVVEVIVVGKNEFIGYASAKTQKVLATAPVEPVVIKTQSLPDGQQNQPYTAVVLSATGTAPITWTATGLPAGMTFDPATATISGTPSVSGTAQVVVTATNAAGKVEKTFPLNIIATGDFPTITTQTLPDGPVGAEYKVTMAFTGGPITQWTVTGLPEGIRFETDPACIIGTPVTAGNYTVSITATNANGSTTVALPLNIVAEPVSGGTETTDPNANPDGSTTPTDPNANPDGSTTPTDPNANPDGSTTPTDPNANPDGSTTPTDPNTNPDGSTTPTDSNANPDGSTTPTDPNTNPDGSTTPTDPNTNPDGSTTPTEPNANPDGSTTPTDPNANPDGSTTPTDPNANPDGSTTLVEPATPTTSETTDTGASDTASDTNTDQTTQPQPEQQQEVVEPTLSSIEVNAKTIPSYLDGDTFSPVKLELYLNYSDNTQKTYTITQDDCTNQTVTYKGGALVAGTNRIELTYMGVSVTFQIDAQAREVSVEPASIEEIPVTQ